MKKNYIPPQSGLILTEPQEMLCASGGIKAEISGYKKNSGNGFTQPYIWLAGIVCSSLLFIGTACSSNTPDQPKQQAELKPRTLIVTQTGDRNPIAVRRLPQATITDAGETLDALWTAGDEISFRNISHATYTPSGTKDQVSLDGVLLADRSARIASFTSNNKVWCDEGDQLLLVYPKTTAPAISVSGTPLTATYTISINKQYGSLATIASTCHHSYGIATVTEVTETTAIAEVAKMQNLLTVCKFSFVDKDHLDTPLPVSSLTISYSDGTYANTYPGTATVTVMQGTPCTATVTPDKKSEAAGGNVLSINPSGDLTEVYVALFPEATATTYAFTLVSGGETYTGTATAQLNAGEFVVATNLRLTK